MDSKRNFLIKKLGFQNLPKYAPNTAFWLELVVYTRYVCAPYIKCEIDDVSNWTIRSTNISPLFSKDHVAIHHCPNASWVDVKPVLVLQS